MFSTLSTAVAISLHADRSAVLVADDHRIVLRAVEDLVVGADGEGLPLAIDASLGLIHIGGRQRRAHVFQAQTVRGQGGRIRLHAYGRFFAAADGHQPDSRKLRNLRGKGGVRQVLDVAQRHGARAERQRQNRRVRRIHLAVDRRVRQVVGRKVPAALMAAWTCCSATSIFRLRSNCRMISDAPKVLVEVI